MYIVYKLLEFSIHLKLYHWNTTKYSRHKASDELYEKIQTGMDTFVECYIGAYKRKEVFKGKSPSIEVKIPDEKNIIICLEHFKRFLEQDIPKIIKPQSTDLYNIRDELLANINQALYLFTLD